MKTSWESTWARSPGAVDPLRYTLAFGRVARAKDTCRQRSSTCGRRGWTPLILIVSPATSASSSLAGSIWAPTNVDGSDAKMASIACWEPS